jgi:hypothetical protein
MGRVKMKKIIYGICLIVVLFAAPVLAFEATTNENGDVVQKAGQGEINWTQGVLSAKGYAAPGQDEYAQEIAAQAGARANLLMILKEVQVKRGLTVEKGMLTQDINIQTVEGSIGGVTFSDLTIDPRGKPMVIAYKRISPDLLRAILPDKVFVPDAGEKPFIPAKGIVPTAPSVQAANPYTGLVIDARGLGIAPSLGLSIVAEGSGQVLYGSSFASRAKVLEKGGMAGYSGTMEKAKTNPRVGKNPLVIKAISSCGERNTDTLISKEDAARVYTENLKNPFLKDLGVVVVCGS